MRSSGICDLSDDATTDFAKGQRALRPPIDPSPFHYIVGAHYRCQDRHFSCKVRVLLVSILELVTTASRQAPLRQPVAQMKALSFLYRMVYSDFHRCSPFDFSGGWRRGVPGFFRNPSPSPSAKAIILMVCIPLTIHHS